MNGGSRPEPRTEIRNHLGQCDPRAEEQRVLLSVGQDAEGAEDPESDAGADADDERERCLSLHVRRERVLDAAQQ